MDEGVFGLMVSSSVHELLGKAQLDSVEVDFTGVSCAGIASYVILPFLGWQKMQLRSMNCCSQHLKYVDSEHDV